MRWSILSERVGHFWDNTTGSSQTLDDEWPHKECEKYWRISGCISEFFIHKVSVGIWAIHSRQKLMPLSTENHEFTEISSCVLYSLSEATERVKIDYFCIDVTFGRCPKHSNFVVNGLPPLRLRIQLINWYFPWRLARRETTSRESIQFHRKFMWKILFLLFFALFISYRMSQTDTVPP